MNFKKYLLFMVIAALAVFVAACGSDNEEDGQANTDAEETGNTDDNASESTSLEGSVVIDGSGTVYPLMAKIAEE